MTILGVEGFADFVTFVTFVFAVVSRCAFYG